MWHLAQGSGERAEAKAGENGFEASGAPTWWLSLYGQGAHVALQRKQASKSGLASVRDMSAVCADVHTYTATYMRVSCIFMYDLQSCNPLLADLRVQSTAWLPHRSVHAQLRQSSAHRYEKSNLGTAPLSAATCTSIE